MGVLRACEALCRTDRSTHWVQLANEFSVRLDRLDGHVLARHQLGTRHLRQHLRLLLELGLAESRLGLGGEAAQHLVAAKPLESLLGVGHLYLAGCSAYDLTAPQLESLARLAVHHEVPVLFDDLGNLVDGVVAPPGFTVD